MGHPDGTKFLVSAGGKVRLEVTKFVEKDTETTGSGSTEQKKEHDDPKRLWKMSVDGTVAKTDIGVAKIDIPIGAATPVGSKFTIKFEYGDSRDASDVRNDPYQVGYTYTIEVTNKCPEGLTAALEDQSGDHPKANECYGKWRATMTATGAAPPGKTNWDGTSLTENVGAHTFEAGKFKANYEIASDNGYTFVIGSAAENKFYDYHSLIVIPVPGGPADAWDLLKAGVMEGKITTPQDYICSPTKKYSFTITRTCKRVGADRIKVDVSK